jgi:hypothetical protein
MVKRGLVGQRHSQLRQLDILTAEILSKEILRNLHNFFVFVAHATE